MTPITDINMHISKYPTKRPDLPPPRPLIT